MDPRLTPANARVAALRLKDQVEAEQFVEGILRSVTLDVVDLLRDPGGARDRQLLYGAEVLVYEEHDGYAYVEAQHDGYVGYVSQNALGPWAEPTHMVSVPATHLYPKANLKTHEIMSLSFGARLRVVGIQGKFHETSDGHFVPMQHIRPIDTLSDDPVDVAQLFLGVPYLWGGNSVKGLDCSALVQASLMACGVAAPGDSDLQEKALGRVLSDAETLKRGDLIFWPGHVAIAVDHEMLIHANGNTMSVAFEGVADAIARIDAQGEGTVSSRRRIE